MGYYDGSSLPMWKLAQEYTLADNFFMGAFGDSFLNHFWLICACTPFDPKAPDNLRAKLDSRGFLQRTPDSPSSALARTDGVHAGRVHAGRLCAHDEPAAVAAEPRAAGQGRRSARGRSVEALPAAADVQDDRRHAVGEGDLVGVVLGRVGRGGRGRHAGPRRRSAWSSPTTNRARRTSSPTTSRSTISRASPRARRTARGTSRTTRTSSPASTAATCRRSRSTSRRDRSTSIRATPTCMSGDIHAAELVARIKASPLWASTVIIFTYDENGGFWDHVAPPKGDRWGPGIAHSGDHHLAVRETRLRRPHVLRHDVDHQVHHAPLRARAAARRARRGGRPHRRVRSRAVRMRARGATNRIT